MDLNQSLAQRMAWPNTEIAPNSDKFGLVDPHRLLTRVWSTPKQAIPLIYNAVILVLHNATSHACLLQTMEIAPVASAKPAKAISNMQVD